VRLKRVIEVRGADAVPSGLICALPALWKGLLYDDDACAAAAELTADWGRDEREAASEVVARAGLGARIGERSILELAKRLLAISAEGLRRIGAAGQLDPDESGFLEPVRAQLALGKSPGEVVLERWEGAWDRSAERLIEYARY
jgi:glutamate--cysteine ligase